MHYLAEAIVFVFLACAVVGTLSYLMDNPWVLLGILGTVAALGYITYADLWSMENLGRVMMGLMVVSIVYGLVFELIPFLWRVALRVGRFFDGLGRRP
jgi:hypothetical protein